MRQPLTEKDIKEIRYQSRIGYILPVLLLLISYAFLFGLLLAKQLLLEISTINIIAITIILISFIISYLMNGKYLADIRNGEKEGELKTIQLKEKKKDFEAGSGCVTTSRLLNITKDMKEFIRYDIVVENTRYQIDEEFYNNCHVGDEVVFYFAPKSRYLIEIALKNNPSIAYSSFYD